MRRITINLCLVVIAMLVFQGCGGAIEGFDVDGFENNMNKVAKQYIKVNNPKGIKKSIINKVAILEFNVEFLVDLNTDEIHKQTVDELYDVFVKEVSAATGWEFVPKELVINSPIYQDLNKKDYITGGGYQKKGGYAYSTTSYIYPATGMGILALGKAKGLKALAGAFKSFGNVQKEPGVLDDVDADAAFKVNVIAFLYPEQKVKKDLRACIPAGVAGLPSGTKVDLNIGYKKDPGGFIGYEDAEGKKWIYNYKTNTSFVFPPKKGRNRLISSINCITEKGKRIKIDEYRKGLMEMFTVYSKMIGTQIKNSM